MYTCTYVRTYITTYMYIRIYKKKGWKFFLAQAMKEEGLTNLSLQGVEETSDVESKLIGQS